MPPKHHILIFIDKKSHARNATTYLNNHPSLAPAQRGQGLVKEYHGGMLFVDYLCETYEDFASPTGTCNILCSTSGTATVCVIVIYVAFEILLMAVLLGN